MHVFTYGSLMFHPVWQRVVPGTHLGRPATLPGYARWRVRGELYPALAPAPPESCVHGVLYLNLSEAEVAALDRFEDEGDLFHRIQVAVELDDGTLLNAWTYLYLIPERVEDALWDPERFEAEDLPRFLDTYCRNRVPE